MHIQTPASSSVPKTLKSDGEDDDYDDDEGGGNTKCCRKVSCLLTVYVI